jgi:hypothetical protein
VNCVQFKGDVSGHETHKIINYRLFKGLNRLVQECCPLEPEKRPSKENNTPRVSVPTGDATNERDETAEGPSVEAVECAGFKGDPSLGELAVRWLRIGEYVPGVVAVSS